MCVRNIVMMCTIGLGWILVDANAAQEARPALVPQPAELKLSPGEFRVTEATRVLVEADSPELLNIGEYLARVFYRTTGYKLAFEPGAAPPTAKNVFILTLAGAPASFGEEGYELTITPDVVQVRAAKFAGVFRALQTIRQLLPADAEDPACKPEGTGVLPCVQITDQPRYRHRGMLLDCGRHFMSKEFVKRYIDLLAYHKLNVLHWHLTEDQGWRIEIKKYPKLTEIGAWRQATRDDEQARDAGGRYGGFYTQEDIKEIVAYAKSRYVTIVPEIEMPGHSLAALASYPELSCTGGPFQVGTQWGVFEDVYCAGNDKTFEFLQDVLAEVLALFPSEFIHIGGDECPKARWSQCPKCQARMKAEGLKNGQELQSYFIRRIEKFLNRQGRRLIGWDEILEGGLAPNATVQSWRGMDGAIAAATSGHDVISSPTSHCYLDFAQAPTPGEPSGGGFVDLKIVYSFEPTPAGLTAEQAQHVLGVEGNMWTERAPQPRVDWQVFPRLCAIAEIGWSPKESRHWDDFAARMQTHYQRLDALSVGYFIPPPQPTNTDFTFTDQIEVEFEPPFRDGVIHYTTNGAAPTAQSPAYERSIRLKDSAVLKARTFLKNGRASDLAELKFKKLQPHAPVAVADAVPGLAYAYYEGRWERLPDFAKLTPAAAGTCSNFDVAVRKRDANFALVFEGYLEIPADSVYTFYLTSDDGSRLWIGDEPVVDNDGLHPAMEKTGQALLKAGKHPLKVEFFQAGGALKFELNYERPGITKQAIPATALWRAQPRR